MAGASSESFAGDGGVPGLASPHRYPHSHSLGDPPTSRGAALAQLQAEVPADLPLSAPLLRTQGPAAASHGALPRHKHKHF